VKADVERIKELGMTPIVAQMISETATVRHDPEKLAHAVVSVIDRSIARRAAYMRPARLYERASELRREGNG